MNAVFFFLIHKRNPILISINGKYIKKTSGLERVCKQALKLGQLDLGDRSEAGDEARALISGISNCKSFHTPAIF